MNRYVAAYPDYLHEQVKSNLTQFLHLALDIDSGRYPSIGRLIERLKLQIEWDDPPAVESQHGCHDPFVQIMTIHAAKGLEAPLVYVADTTARVRSPRATKLILDWPPTDDQPNSFYLGSRSLSPQMQKHIDADGEKQSHEELNLLYVAITRSKQY